MTDIRRTTLAIAIALIAWLPASRPAAAQVSTADVIGTVTDSSGAALPGATVTLTSPATGSVRTQVSDETGGFTFTLVQIGGYRLRAELQGFGPHAADLQLSAGDRQRVDVQLSVGSLNETVAVTAERPVVQSDSATVSALLPERAVQDLPLNGRNVVALVRMVAGANEGLPSSLSSGNRPDDRRQTSTVSVNGQNDVVNNNLIDGMDNNERYTGTLGVRPSIDAIAEVKVQTNTYTAETGRTAGAVVNILTKAGTNEFHGSAYGFFRNEKFDARDFFAPANQPTPRVRQQQFGGSIGGPIVRNRTFFFTDYERFDLERGVTWVSSVPSAAMRTGDFSELLARNILIYDPLSTPRQPFPGNVIPAGRVDQVAQRFLNLYPVPTSPGLANNFNATVNRTQVADTFDARVDHRFDDDHMLYARYSVNSVETVVPGVFGLVNGVDSGGSAAGFGGPSLADVWGLHLNYLQIFSPTFLMEAKVGRTYFNTESLTETYGQNVAASLGLPGININDLTSSLPNIVVAGYTTLGDARFVPILLKNKAWQGQVTVTNVRGNHNLKAGVNLVKRTFSPIQSNDGTGLYNFTAGPTNNGVGVGGDSAASFLLGYPSTVARANLIADTTFDTWEPGVFVQDDWRATNWLTLNLGLRYDIYTALSEHNGQIANIDPATLNFLIPGQNGVGNTAGVQTDYGNVAPRLGAAATIRPGLVLRGGYGLSFFPSSIGSNAVLRNTPFTYTFNQTSLAASGGPPDAFFAAGLPAPAQRAPSLSGTIAAVDTNLKSSYLHQYNVILEKELWGSSISAGYVGSQGRRLWMSVPNLNFAPPGPGAVNPRRPYAAAAPALQTLQILRSAGTQNYNALQVSVTRRSRAGLTFGGNYTFAKGTSNVTQPGGGGAAQGYGVLPGQIESLELGASDIDIRHRYAFTLNYQLPFGATASGLRRVLTADWQANLIGYWQSGLPFTVVNATPRSNTGVGANGDRPDQICDGALDNPTVNAWFDTSCFVGQALNTVGNGRRNNLYGPPQRRLDASVFKDLSLGRHRLQLRVEVFNVTNTPSFGVPNGSLGSPTFGRITTTANNVPRQFQLAAKYLF